MADYNKGIDVPEWWLLQAAPRIKAKWTHAKLAKQASDLAGRETPWGGDRITKLLENTNATLELVNAVSDAIGLARPVFIARHEPEAKELMATAKTFDVVGIRAAAVPKVAAALQRVEAMAKDRSDQTKPVDSENERNPRGPGARRPPRGR